MYASAVMPIPAQGPNAIDNKIALMASMNRSTMSVVFMFLRLGRGHFTARVQLAVIGLPRR